MSMPSLLSNAKHFHVTEREIAHYWPDGQWDDASWEDCTFVSAVELARICHKPSIPASHVEAEKLRDVAGVRPTGGSNQDDARRGMARRYLWDGSTPISGFSAFWAALDPGMAASSQGTMAFPYGHRLRRWSPGFNGRHCVLVVRVDSRDRVWWCDPLAPNSVGYQGEWVSKSELKAYVDRLTAAGGRHVIGKVRKPIVATHHLSFLGGAFFTFKVDLSGRIISRTTHASIGTTGAPCTPRKLYPSRIGDSTYLVTPTKGFMAGVLIGVPQPSLKYT
jgi:hypothetical protein